MKTFYITTPIYYVNDRPHIGHAYTTIAADVLARWKRSQGEKVFFLTGTDEHGSKIAQAAGARGQGIKEYVDLMASEFQKLWKELNISNDDFIRTTEKRHIQVVQAVLHKLKEKGEIYKGHYEDWYCVACESFWLESQLRDLKCPECGKPVEKLREESYFFSLSKYTDKLLEHYNKEPLFLSPKDRSQEIVNFVKGGLKDLSISRLKEKWGVPLPFDESHTTYVWFDALLNYLTAAGYTGDHQRGFQDLWPADIHFVGKEIFRFHAAIWPAMLLALGLPLPSRVFAHGWWTVDGEKMSKSKGNVVDPHAVIQEFGSDGLRYFLLREMPFGADGDFSVKALTGRYNSDLANDLGNLFSRTLTLAEKNFDGVLNRAPENVILPKLAPAQEGVHSSFEDVKFHEVLDHLNSIVREANRYLDQKAPWNLVKSDKPKAESVLSECVSVLRWLVKGYYPFMPDSASKMWDRMGEDPELLAAKEDNQVIFTPGKKVHKEGILFPRKNK